MSAEWLQHHHQPLLTCASITLCAALALSSELATAGSFFPQ
jgi:hypothetical protein